MSSATIPRRRVYPIARKACAQAPRFTHPNNDENYTRCAPFFSFLHSVATEEKWIYRRLV